MKRIAAIVLPDLACELAREDHRLDDRPFSVIVDDAGEDDDIDRRAMLDAVDPLAWQYGARPGQTAAQATAYVGQLRVVRLTRARVRSALSRVAEMALGLGTTASLDLEQDGVSHTVLMRYPNGAGAGPHDTLWLDVTGCARLVGGEDVLCAELRERARELGHRARVAIAGGPRIARAFARWAPAAELVIPPGADAAHLAELPIAALPLSDELGSWLLKLGLLCIGDLAELDRKRLSHRLRSKKNLDVSRDLLELIAGRDDMPLKMLELPRHIVEHSDFEQGLCSTEPLSFVLRGFTARAIARLGARGEACARASLLLRFDRAVIDLANRHGAALAHEQRVDIDLPVPLSREEELMRALQAKLERLELPAPVVALSLILDDLCPQNHQQLDLGRGKSADPNALPLLLAELGAWLGPSRLGVLRVVDSHRPEARSSLVPVVLSPPPVGPGPRQSAMPALSSWDSLLEPTRILHDPIPVGRLATGNLVSADHSLFAIDRLRLAARIDRVEWWSATPVSRDYARAWLRTNTQEHCEYGEAWMFMDQHTGKGFLHGWYE